MGCDGVGSGSGEKREAEGVSERQIKMIEELKLLNCPYDIRTFNSFVDRNGRK